MPINTVRAWVLGMLLTTIASGLNALFALRQPAITITSLTVQLVAYPLGVAWHRAIPSRQFRLFGRSFSLNPCPFNMKEHTIIVVMANVNVAGGVGICYGYSYSAERILSPKLWLGLQHTAVHIYTDDWLWIGWHIPQGTRLAR